MTCSFDQTNDDAEFPFLQLEMEWIKARHEHKKPMLGICLGAQLIAKTLGANVYSLKEKEIGWYPIEVSNTADYPFFNYLMQDGGQQFHFHGGSI